MAFLNIFDMFELEIEPSSLAESSQDLMGRISLILDEALADKVHFEDSSDFLTWAEEHFPFISSRKDPANPGVVFIVVFSWYSIEFCSEYYGVLLKKRLILQKAVSGLSIQHYDFGLSYISNKRFCLMEIKVPESEVDESYLFSLQVLARQVLSDTRPSKEMHVLQETENARRRFHQWLEGSVLDEVKAFFAFAGREFIEKRSLRLLRRLIISQHLIRKDLVKRITGAPDIRHATCRLLSAKLTFPFTSKTVLGIFVGIHFLHKHEFFSEEHLLRAIQKLIPEVQSISGSLYAFQRQGDPFKFIYLEVEKKEGLAFTLKERQLLSLSLNEQIKWSVERLQPAVFMVNNEEEVAKNILVLSREITSVADFPQVTIHFEEQKEHEVKFRIVMVRPLNKRRLPLEKSFQKIEGAAYVPGKTQTVRYLEKNRLIQAQVFHLCITKNPAFLRSDSSLNFYAARSQISELLTKALGPFRDYNGGIILKQGEKIEQLKRHFRELPSDIVENFFYGLTPIEVQSTIALNVMASLFELFLERKGQTISQKTDHFTKSFRKENRTFCVLQTHDSQAYELLVKTYKETTEEHDSLVYTHIWDGDSHISGFIFESPDLSHHTRFEDRFQRGISAWKKQLESLKTLRLAIYSNLLYLDPRIRGGEDKNAILKMLFEGLTQIDNQGKIILGIAKSVEVSKNKKTYTFRLRSTVWSNGMPVTASDFEYTWKTVLSPHFQTPFAYLFYPIENAQEVKEGKLHPDFLGVRALDSKTLQIKLKSPSPYFLELITLPQFFPVNQMIDTLEPDWPTQQGEKFVCNGAFKLKTNHPIRGYELVKNPLYLEASKIQLDGITIKKARISEIQEMLLQDQIDWAGAPLGFINFSPFPRSAGESIVLPNELLQWYVFNTQKFPFNCIKLRRALSLVINRMRILQKIPPGSWPAFTVLPLHQTRAAPMEENKEEGIRLFQEALQELNLDKKNFSVIKLMYTEGGVRSAVANIIKEEWEQSLGIRCSIEACEWHSLFAKITDGNFEVCAMDWIALIDDPNYTLEIFRKNNALINFPKWYNKKYEQLLDRAQGETEKQKRLSLFALAEEILIQEAAVVPILRTLPQSIKKSRIKLHHYSSMKSWNFKWTTIQTSLK
jgi:oligopeptide transport system substrate-binding protein